MKLTYLAQQLLGSRFCIDHLLSVRQVYQMDGSHEGFGQQWHKMLAFGDQQRQIAYGNDITLKVKNY